jgi:hypothetical protein
MIFLHSKERNEGLEKSQVLVMIVDHCVDSGSRYQISSISKLVLALDRSSVLRY